MFLKQYYLGCLAHASYLIADEKTKSAAVVDPQRDIDQYLADAQSHGFKIDYVILTHFHADFLAGHIELRNRAGAKIVMGMKAQAEFDFQAMKDGESIEMGDVRLQFLETPGHTPEGISVLVFDLAADKETPHAVLTGDTLFIGDVGRPDLLASIGVTADELAVMLYESLDKLRKLPDSTLVYPAHGAGSMCGKNLSKETVSTIGEQKEFNYALKPMPFETFRDLVTSDQPDAPEYFVYDAIKNRQERSDLESTMKSSMKALDLDEVLEMQKQNAQVVDVREAIDFEGAHLVGSINIGLQGKYATWCGSILSHDTPIVVIAEAGNEEEAVMRLGRIGFDNVAGYLRDGMAALESRPELVEKIQRITAPALAEQLAAPKQPLVLDVRSEREWNGGHIAGSKNIPLPHLQDRISEIPENRSLVVHCEGGYRSAIASSLLSRAGRRDLLDLVGGIKAWNASQLPTTTDGATGATCSGSAACTT
jgi:glyoxylase-like metal-dependent hydrolase (beta-lactamase superfamily II)/rhodanese-related sulfurtransferase